MRIAGLWVNHLCGIINVQNLGGQLLEELNILSFRLGHVRENPRGAHTLGLEEWAAVRRDLGTTEDIPRHPRGCFVGSNSLFYGKYIQGKEFPYSTHSRMRTYRQYKNQTETKSLA